MNGRKGANELAIFFVLLGCILAGLALSLMVFYSFNTQPIVTGNNVASEPVVYVVPQKAEDPLYYQSLYAPQTDSSNRRTSHRDDNRSRNDLEEGLVAYYAFDESTGATKFVDSNENHDASCSGTLCPQSGVSGHKGNAVQFDGINDLVEIPGDNAFSFHNAFSVSFWFKVDDTITTNVSQFFIGRLSAQPNMVSWLADIPAGGICQNNRGVDFYVSKDGKSGDDNSRVYRRECGLVPHGWTHFVGVFVPGNKIELYIDGKLVGTTVGDIESVDTVFGSSEPIRVGSGFGNFAEMARLKGAMDELRIYDRALSASEVDDLGNL